MSDAKVVLIVGEALSFERKYIKLLSALLHTVTQPSNMALHFIVVFMRIEFLKDESENKNVFSFALKLQKYLSSFILGVKDYGSC